MTSKRRHLVIGSWASFLSLVLAAGCGDSAHTLGSTGGGGQGGGTTAAGGTTSRGGAGGGGNGGSAAGGGGASGAIGTGGTAAATGGTGGGGTGKGGAGAAGGSGGGGAAGGAAGHSGTGGAAGNGNTGGATAGTTGRGGTGGGTGGGAGAGGASVACLSVQSLDRSCTVDTDCFAATNIADCCGRLQYIGLSTTEQSAYTSLEQQCQSEWPACACATRPTVTDDGSTIINAMAPSGVAVKCQQGVCTTYVRNCGGPCASGTTCFSCQVTGGQYGACTTACTDTTASSDCTNAALPRCQSGQSGTVDGTYCTAASVMCDTRSSTTLTDCAGLTCDSSHQIVNVRNPALGTTQCACAATPSAGPCSDCTCGEALCTPYGGHCSGFSTASGLLCSLNG